MTLDETVTALNATVVHRGSRADSSDIRSAVASDLMSDLLVADRHGHLLLTSLASDQAIRSADIVGAAAVAVTNGKTLPASMIALARELDMPLLRTTLRTFEACAALARAMG